MDPSTYEQLQGKRNARTWKRKFKVAALGKGVWDVFTGVYTAVACPQIEDYGLQSAQENATSTDKSDDKEKDETGKIDKGKRKARTTLGPDEISDFLKQSAAESAQQKKGVDFNSRMTLYKFTLDEYDKGRKITATALALLITWVHESLRGQLEAFADPKEAYDHLVARYSVTDARAREVAENQFNTIYMSRFTSAQDYINAIENAQQDILEAGGFCDEPMMISKIVRGLRGHPMFRDFATQYHLLRDIDPKFEQLDQVITQLLTFESTNSPEPDFRSSTGYGNRFVSRAGFSPREQRSPRIKCTGCGIWGHSEPECKRTHAELRPQNNGYTNRPGGAYGNNNNNNRNNYNNNRNNNNSGTGFRRGPKPNGMAASAIVDDKAFAAALECAKTDAENSLKTIEGH